MPRTGYQAIGLCGASPSSSPACPNPPSTPFIYIQPHYQAVVGIDMSAKSPDAESRDNSPDHEGSPGKRPGKKRKVLSCYACRNRKMKCDRVFPVCGRCQKTGRAEQCTYDPRLLEDFTGSNALHVDGVNANPGPIEVGTHQIGAGTSSLDALQWKARIQERRILELESKLAAKESSINPSYHQDIHPQELNIKEEVMFRGKGFKTSFHGTTSIASTISQVC